MSSMACRCGHRINDVSGPSPTEAALLREQDQESYHNAFARDVESFLEAVREDRRTEWLARYFSGAYLTDLSDGDIVDDILSIHQRRSFLSVAECEECGRLWVQRSPDVNEYQSYWPDLGGYGAALRSRGSTDRSHRAAIPASTSADPRTHVHVLLEQVRDAPSFLVFAQALASDAGENPESWGNASIHGFLEAAIAWTADTSSFPSPTTAAGGVWRVFARFLLAGKGV